MPKIPDGFNSSSVSNPLEQVQNKKVEQDSDQKTVKHKDCSVSAHNDDNKKRVKDDSHDSEVKNKGSRNVSKKNNKKGFLASKLADASRFSLSLGSGKQEISDPSASRGNVHGEEKDLPTPDHLARNKLSYLNEKNTGHISKLLAGAGAVTASLGVDDIDGSSFNVSNQVVFDIYDGKADYIEATKAQVGFIEGEVKPKKAPLPEESRANMTTGKLNKYQKSLYFQGEPRFIEAKKKGSEPVETILIHGTFNPDAPEIGWTQPDNQYNQDLRSRYGGKLSSLQWSGKNHRHARIEAAQALANRIKENTANNIKTNIIAHSHGGNVAFEAIKLLDDSGAINELVTLGTPIRTDHLPSLEKIQEKTYDYIHVSGGKDTVAPKGGVDFVGSPKDIVSDKFNFSLNTKKSNRYADVELHIADANHSELHRRAVLELFGKGEMTGHRQNNEKD